MPAPPPASGSRRWASACRRPPLGVSGYRTSSGVCAPLDDSARGRRYVASSPCCTEYSNVNETGHAIFTPAPFIFVITGP